MSKLLNFLRSKVYQLAKQNKKNQNLILATMFREML
jgi:hypothetical protein